MSDPFNPVPPAVLVPPSEPGVTVTGGAHLPGAPVARNPVVPAAATAPVYPVNGIDCSPEAQARRWEQLQDLESRLVGGITSVCDRNRQVSFGKPEDLARAINMLRSQLAYCQTGEWPTNRGMRLHYGPQVKAL